MLSAENIHLRHLADGVHVEAVAAEAAAGVLLRARGGAEAGLHPPQGVAIVAVLLTVKQTPAAIKQFERRFITLCSLFLLELETNLREV